MTFDQAATFAVLAAALALFARGVWRYDVVALLALLAAVFLGLVPADRAFLGFGHPAVITVAAVLVLGSALEKAGAVDLLARRVARIGGGRVTQVAALTGVTALASCFMNNVGALALMMPVAIRVARDSGTPRSMILMPLAFSSLLGGLTTLIGTPPNIIIASYREAHGAEAFGLFDFTPVGGAVAVAGVLFLSLVGWRLVPRRAGAADRKDWSGIGAYITEMRVPAGAKAAGKAVAELGDLVEGEVVVAGIVRGGRRVGAPSPFEVVRAGDALIVEVDPDRLDRVLAATGLELAGGKEGAHFKAADLGLVEAVVKPESPVIGESAETLRLRQRHGVNLLAVAREGAPLRRLKDQRFRKGDVLLLQGPTDTLPAALRSLECLPLAERGLRLRSPRKLATGAGLFLLAIVATALHVVPAHVAFASAGVGMVVFRLLRLDEAYRAVEWPVLILLGAMLPVGEALETTGCAGLVADGLLVISRSFPTPVTLGLVLVATMLLSDVVNNAAAAVIMAPIGLAVAAGLGASPDPFLMAVAIGASSTFLTPIGHQSNTLVLGPGGYRFSDYWRLGLPLDALIVAVSLPLLVLVWPH